MRKAEKQYIQKVIFDLFKINVEFFTKTSSVVGYCIPKEDKKLSGFQHQEETQSR